MTKRTLQQIEESLRDKFAEASDDGSSIAGATDDVYHLGGRGKPQQIDIGLGGASRSLSSKPKVSLQKAKELGIVKPDPKVWRRASDVPTLTDVIPTKQPKVWRRGEPETITPQSQTPQEKLTTQAQAQAKSTGEPVITVPPGSLTSKILDKLFPEKLSDLAKQRVEPKLDEQQKPEYTKEQYIDWAKKYADQYQVPLSMVLHAMHKETGWLGNPEKMRVARSPTGATGVMQIQPEYAEKGYGIKLKDLLDPQKNIEAGVRGLAGYLSRHKTPEKALAAYNAGESGAKEFLRTGDISKLRAKETRDYIKNYKDDVVHQLEKFYPKNKQKVTQLANNILATAVGAKDAQAQEISPAADKSQVSTDMTKKQQTDSFADKLKRVAGGELASQAFGDKNKNVQPAAEKKDKKLLDKATDFVKQFSRPEVASSVTATSPLMMPAMIGSELLSKKLSGDTKAEPKTKQSVSGTVDYSQRPVFAPKPEPKINLQKDQTGLVQAKKQLSDFERAFAAARAEKGAGETFSWTNPKTGKTGVYTTLYKGEKSPATPPATMGSIEKPDEPMPGELDKATPSFSTARDIDKTEPQADGPDEIEKIIKAKQAEITPDAPMPTDQEIEAAKARMQKNLADIDRELADKALVKESINTQSRADLHDILRLAGRLK